MQHSPCFAIASNGIDIFAGFWDQAQPVLTLRIADLGIGTTATEQLVSYCPALVSQISLLLNTLAGNHEPDTLINVGFSAYPNRHWSMPAFDPVTAGRERLVSSTQIIAVRATHRSLRSHLPVREPFGHG
jgi:hypothetical protein